MPSSLATLERTRYFQRQIVGPEDLTQDQSYFRDRDRRHNRFLHGWGVVCGACVAPDPDDDCAVIVDPGYILGPYGDEIVIENRVRVDLCKQDVNGNAVSPCADTIVDPWCSDVRIDERSEGPLYVAVKYAECSTRPVRSLGCGCGCDDGDCEYSRTRDSYAIRVLTELPDSYRNFGRLQGLLGLLVGVSCLGEKGRPCPPCPSDPWVILADVTMAGGKVSEVSCLGHRRLVMTAAYGYATCGPTRLGSESVSKQLFDREAVLTGSLEEAPATMRMKTSEGAWLAVPATFEVGAARRSARCSSGRATASTSTR